MTATIEKGGGGFLEQQMLIAMPGMVDANFAGSVTLLCQHSDAGAIGITINRLSTFTLGEILAQLQIDCSDEQIRNRPVLEGGPVAPDRGFVIHSPQLGYESSMPIGQDMMVTTSRDVLSEIAEGAGPEKYLVALGYAGWGGGQLEGEMLANAWVTVNADTDIVFDLPLPSRFEEALGRLGIQVDCLLSEAGHA
ncbi:MAG: YqgE/AlgH family protein [Gammaproteobacteria bacterium]|nr:YqgE/AlgH family protein [Gammaproteobacteria bacterium]MBT8064505.1 YqgE/AlgH family protein [Gammaproteobacteria bacterium]NNK31780.1 YqgE/AlgH family protein [Xanthomonadales bacterium]